MLSYYSTGAFPKQLDQPTRFKPRQASKGDAESMYKRNYEDPQKYEFKQPAQGFNTEYHHKQYHKINADYQPKGKFFATQHHTTQAKSLEPKTQIESATRQQNLENPSHMNNWKIVKERKYAERVKQPNADCEQGKILPKENYSSQTASEQQKANWLSRSNLFEISRPLVRLDKDMKSVPLIKNVQTVSDDLPNWCTATNKYYTPESFEQTMKLRQQRLAKADILGNTVQEPKKDPDNKCYQQVPFYGQRFEPNKMCVFYEKQDRGAVENGKLRQSKVNLTWKENQSMQRFEPKLQQNIGTSNQPFYKSLVCKLDPKYDKYDKIGESEVYKRMDKDKAIQLKIGHGQSGTLNPVKY